MVPCLVLSCYKFDTEQIIVSVNYSAQTCVWWAKWTPYAPNLRPVHHWGAQELSCMHLDLTSFQHAETLVDASRVNGRKRYMQKSYKLHETALLMLWLLKWSSAVMCKQWDHMTSCNQQVLRKFDFLQKALKFMASDVTLWTFFTLWKIGNKFPMLTLTP